MCETRQIGGHIADLSTACIDFELAGHHAEYLYWGFYDTQPWRNYLHVHSFYEVCYAYAGRGTFQIGDALHTVTSGTIFVARPGELHEIVSSDDDPLGIYFWAYTLIEQPDNANRIADDPSRSLLEMFADTTFPPVSTRPGRIPTLLTLLAREAQAPSPGCTDVVGALARILIVDTAHAFVRHPTGGSLTAQTDHWHSRGQAAAETMIRYLKDNYNRPISVRDVATQVHLSPRHAGRLFRRATGQPIHAYLAHLRLEIAAQRLLEHSSSIKAIAQSCGYPDVRHFATAFRRHWGAPPGRFRRRNGTTRFAIADPRFTFEPDHHPPPAGSRPRAPRQL